MSILITTCIMCGHHHEVDIDASTTRCPRCGHFYYLDDDERDEPDAGPEPDYGGAFDGHTVTSDADPGL